MRWLGATNYLRDRGVGDNATDYDSYEAFYGTDDESLTDEESSELYEERERIAELEAMEKYQIPYGVWLDPGLGINESDTDCFMQFAKWWVEGKMDDEIYDTFIFHFCEVVEVDYFWVLMDQPGYFYEYKWPEWTNEPTCIELEPELKQIGTRSKKKATMKYLLNIGHGGFSRDRKVNDTKPAREPEEEPEEEQPKEEPRYITAEDICAMFSISLRTVKRMQSNGILKAHKLGPHMVRFRADEVEASIFSR